ncbi:KDEL receptor B [Dunaliella salina]|uniref:KDEL receptor B n=1 Tax=Dunaliella salina TaxID=3046 RepID=A0ABQ7GCC1_DUNSA|nr:KDEL receptor B [Dunaliella salina]|eukprot:KAF5832248.1 KDEL receptor B [Dunaliella salina]
MADVTGKVKDPVLVLARWLRNRNARERTMLGVLGGVLLLLLLWRTIEDHDTLFVLAELSHFAGIAVLAFKIHSRKSVAGLSLQTQLLTAIYLSVRLFCSFMMEYDIHTVLDALTLLATCIIVYCMTSTEVALTYQKEQDKVKSYYVVVPCVVLALIAHPSTSHAFPFRALWSFCVYLEAVSVLPQLRMIQKSKVVERFTAHYVFALGLSRFMSCAHWLLQIMEGNKYLLQALGSGLWPVMVLLSEIVQTFILADFCYYYVKSYAEGTGVIRLPTGVV